MNVPRALLPVPLLVLLTACATRDSTPAGATAEAASPAAAAAEPTAKEVSDYRLDMDKMRKFTIAMRGFAEAARTDSTAAMGMSAGSGATTAQMISRLESHPLARNVLREAGLSAEDYVWITAAWLQAAMTAGSLEASPDAKMPEGQNPQNLEFLKANKAQIEAYRDLSTSLALDRERVSRPM